MEETFELKFYINIISDDSTEESVKYIKKNVLVRKVVSIYDIKNPTQLINSKGKIVKNKCRIFIKDEGELTVNHPYKEMVNLIRNFTKISSSTKIGFKLKRDNR